MPRLGQLERRGQREDRLAVLDGQRPAACVNERPSRTRSTVYTIGTDGSPGRMKYECSEWTDRSAVDRPAGRDQRLRRRPDRRRSVASTTAGSTPRKMFSSICSRSEQSSRPSGVDRPSCPVDSARGRAERQRSRCSDVADVVDPDGVRRPRRRRRRAGDDDHQVVRVTHAALDQRASRPDAPCRRWSAPSRPGTPRPPRAAPSAAARCSSGVNTSSRCAGCSRDSRRAVSPVWVNATSATAPSASPMSLAALTIAPPDVRGSCCSPRHRVPAALDRGDDPAMVATACTGYLPTLVSPDSITASAPSSTALATSEASARVGREWRDHRLEHLGRDDDRLGVVAADLDRALLHDRDLLERHLDAEVAAGDHDAVEGEHDLFEPIDRLRLLDLRDDRTADADLVHHVGARA